MTKREFVKLKKGDILLVIRHLINDAGIILINENSEWKVENIELTHLKGQGRKPCKTAYLQNISNGKTYTLTKDNSANFLVYRRKRGRLPKT